MRDGDEDLIESRRRTITIIDAELKEVRFILARRRFEEKFNPDWPTQPRAPAGGSDGGQWVGGGGAQSAHPAAPARTGPPIETIFPAETVIAAAGDNPIRIARRRLGPHARSEEVIAYAHELQTINKVADPTHLRAGAPLVLPEAQAGRIDGVMWASQLFSTSGAPFHSLNAHEYIAGKIAFGDLISNNNLRAVRIVRGPGNNPIAAGALADPTRPAITLGNTYFVQASLYDRWHGDLTSAPDARELLMHELTHVLQWQNLGFPVGPSIILQAVTHGPDETYNYNHRPAQRSKRRRSRGRRRWLVTMRDSLLSRDSPLRERTDLRGRLAGTGIYGH